MTVKKREIKEEKKPEQINAGEKKLEDLSVNELKAEVYDRASMIEQYQMEIQKLQKEIQEVNKHIVEKTKK